MIKIQADSYKWNQSEFLLGLNKRVGLNIK